MGAQRRARWLRLLAFRRIPPPPFCTDALATDTSAGMSLYDVSCINTVSEKEWDQMLPSRLSAPPPAHERLPVGPGDVCIETGYRLDPVAVGLTFPTSIAFDETGRLHIAESGFSYGPAKTAAQGRVLRLEDDGRLTPVVSGLRGPVTGIAFGNGCLYCAEGAFPGRILKVGSTGCITPIVDGLRSGGDHYTSELAFGPDGRLYFGVGSFTNSGVVGVDNFQFGWLSSMPQEHDVPARPTVLKGVNYSSANPFTLNDQVPCTTVTGAFKPFGTPSTPGEVIPGSLMANGVIYSVNPDGSDLRLVADGFRNPFGIGFYCGQLYTLDQGYDARGSRPVTNSPDSLWQVTPGGWYGFPDFVAGYPITCPEFHTPGQPAAEFVMAEHPPLAGQPVLRLTPHSASTKFAVCTNPAFGHVGDMFIAQLGPGELLPGGARPGYKVVRAELQTGQVSDFVASVNPLPGGKGPQRPVDVKFSPDGRCLYVLDFGTLEPTPSGIIPYCGSGMLWSVTRAY
jgi:glucose/arabinose dehydrogenase